MSASDAMPGRPGSAGWDESLARLEDVLLGLPFDRALPDLATVLRVAGVDEDLLRIDERAAKVIHEAIVARPLSSTDAISTLRTEVELLTLEVEVLTERLGDRRVSQEEVARASERLAVVRRRLEEIRRDL